MNDTPFRSELQSPLPLALAIALQAGMVLGLVYVMDRDNAVPPQPPPLSVTYVTPAQPDPVVAPPPETPPLPAASSGSSTESGGRAGSCGGRG